MSSAAKTKKVPFGKKLLSVLPVSFFAVLTLLFFGPLEVFWGNVVEFKFSVATVTVLLALVCIGLAAIFALLLSLLPPKLLKAANVVVFGGGLCVYAQSVLLNGHMGSLTGESDVYSRGLILGNLAVWILIFCAVIAAWLITGKLKKSKYFFKGIRFAACLLMAMQLVGLFSVYLKVDTEAESLKDRYFTQTGRYELAEGENVVFFIIDTCDGGFVSEALVQEPGLFDAFDGFTYFPNATTTHSRTYPSLPYLLTGQICYFDKPYTQYINEAYENSSFIRDMDALGTDIRLYTGEQYLGQSAADLVDNYVTYDSAALDSIHFTGFLKKAVKVSAYRCAPYLLKDKFRYSSEEINADTIKGNSDKAVIFDDPRFAQEVRDGNVTVNTSYSKAFRLYHLLGPHPGAVMDEYGNWKPGVSLIQATRGCIRVVGEYVAEMKKNGTFENSTIIITADHGNSVTSDDLSLTMPTSCLMLVKPAGGDASLPVKTSNAPVCHADLFATVIEGLGGDAAKYGRTIWQIDEDEARERLYYHTALYSDKDGEVVLREYAVRGDARYLENYHLTGRYWDVLYSERPVSQNRFEP